MNTKQVHTQALCVSRSKYCVVVQLVQKDGEQRKTKSLGAVDESIPTWLLDACLRAAGKLRLAELYGLRDANKTARWQ